ncbi:MAG: hypothetical protein ABSG49_09330 [Methanoregula sp.]|jgi:predicted aldo/keto reductase-like oxidoreductase|uniref:hypothetical protein n=1 Tax=Methanoregula sp. TaxID=2052170 RepID=UPI003C1ADA55
MLYRKMNKAAPELSILGFGCMRLPEKDNGQRLMVRVSSRYPGWMDLTSVRA